MSALAVCKQTQALPQRQRITPEYCKREKKNTLNNEEAKFGICHTGSFLGLWNHIIYVVIMKTSAIYQLLTTKTVAVGTFGIIFECAVFTVHQIHLVLLMSAAMVAVVGSSHSLASERSSIESTYELTKFLEYQLKEIKDVYVSFILLILSM